MEGENIHIDFTLQQKLNQHLNDKTSIIREQIEKKRKDLSINTNKYCEYSATIFQMNAYVTQKYVEKLYSQAEYDQLVSQDVANIEDSKVNNIFIQKGHVVLALCTKTLYPYYRGFAKVNGVKKQCYHIVINGKKQTMIGIAYSQQFDKDNLGDALGIMVAEQVRFNTLDAVCRYFLMPEYDGFKRLFQILSQSFKKQVYCNWKNYWSGKIYQREEFRKYTQNKYKLAEDITGFQIVKLLKYID